MRDIDVSNTNESKIDYLLLYRTTVGARTHEKLIQHKLHVGVFAAASHPFTAGASTAVLRNHGFAMKVASETEDGSVQLRRRGTLAAPYCCT